MMKYSEFRAEQQRKVDALPMHWAFSKSQFKEEIKEMGLTENDTGVLVRLPFNGAFCLKTDFRMIIDTLKSLSGELDKKLASDDEFCIDAIEYELGNHEYGYTLDHTDAMEALNLSLEDERIKRLFGIARKQYLAKCE